MNFETIDLRSDTVTRPGDGMRRAMANAIVGDDVLGDDPTVKILEEEAAIRLGKQGAIYVPSGTMANLVALLVHCRRGDEAIVGSESHILQHEGTGASALGGISLRSARNDDRGCMDDAEITALMRPSGTSPRTALLCLENTHNRCGGSAVSLANMRSVTTVAREGGALVHLDGARIFNAALALETDVATIASEADTVSTCFSKGLGAPVGSVLAGPDTFIDQARIIRRQLGGGMRQSGVIAAAALYALQHNVDRLVDDHVNARRLAEGLSGISGININPDTVDSNIVFFELDCVDGNEFRTKLSDEGLLCSGTSSQRVRMVTHLDIGQKQIDRACTIVAEAMSSL